MTAVKNRDISGLVDLVGQYLGNKGSSSALDFLGNAVEKLRVQGEAAKNVDNATAKLAFDALTGKDSSVLEKDVKNLKLAKSVKDLVSDNPFKQDFSGGLAKELAKLFNGEGASNNPLENLFNASTDIDDAKKSMIAHQKDLADALENGNLGDILSAVVDLQKDSKDLELATMDRADSLVSLLGDSNTSYGSTSVFDKLIENA